MTPHKRRRNRRNPRAKDASYLVTPSRGLLTEAYGPVCRIQRTLTFEQATTAVDRSELWNWSLSDVTNANEFKTLFQQWKLEMVTVDIVWRPPIGSTGGPRFVYTMDPFFSTSSTISMIDMVQRKARVWAPNPTRNTLRIVVRPRVSMVVVSAPGPSPTSNLALAPAGSWYSCDSDTTSYGSLVAFTQDYNTGVPTSGVLTHYHTLHFAFRGAR